MEDSSVLYFLAAALRKFCDRMWIRSLQRMLLSVLFVHFLAFLFSLQNVSKDLRWTRRAASCGFMADMTSFCWRKWGRLCLLFFFDVMIAMSAYFYRIRWTSQCFFALCTDQYLALDICGCGQLDFRRGVALTKFGRTRR